MGRFDNEVNYMAIDAAMLGVYIMLVSAKCGNVSLHVAPVADATCNACNTIFPFREVT